MQWRLVLAVAGICLVAPIGMPPFFFGAEARGAEQVAHGAAVRRVVRQSTPVPESGNAAICAAGQDAVTPAVAPDWLSAALPAGAELSLLASAVVDELPREASGLHASSLFLAPATSSQTQLATGPMLYATRRGVITLYIDGVPVVIESGASVSLHGDQLYAVANETDEPAAVLRLAVAPPSDESVEVAEFAPALPTGAGADGPIVVPLVQGPPLPMPEPPARLFLACLTWQQPSAGAERHSHPGPIGVWIERGTLTVEDARTLPTQGCAMFLSGTSHQTRAGEPGTTVLLFGLLPEGEPLWQPAAAVAAAVPVDGLTCGEAVPAAP